MTVLHGKVTFDSLVQRVKVDTMKQARKIRDPEGDIAPTIYLYRPESRTLHVHDVSNHFTSRAARDEFLNKMQLMIRVGEVTLSAYSMTGYGGFYDHSTITPEERAALDHNELPDGWLPPSQRPDRIEALWVHIFDAEIVQSWMSVVTRSPSRPPRFTQWKMYRSGVGRMVDPILEAMR